MSGNVTDSDSDNIVELRISDSGHISLSDITAATIGPLDPDMWNSTDSGEHSPTTVHRPWTEESVQFTDEQQQPDSSTDSQTKTFSLDSLQARHVMPQLSPEVAIKFQQQPPTYHESQYQKTTDIETASKRRRLELDTLNDQEPLAASYDYGALLQATAEHSSNNDNNNSHSIAPHANTGPSSTYSYDMLKKAIPDTVHPLLKDDVDTPKSTKSSTIHYPPTTEPPPPHLTSPYTALAQPQPPHLTSPYTALAQTFNFTSHYDNKTELSPIPKTGLLTSAMEVPSQYTWNTQTQSDTLYSGAVRNERQTVYNKTWSYSSNAESPVANTGNVPRYPTNQTQSTTSMSQQISNVTMPPQGHSRYQSTTNVKPEFQPWVKTEDPSNTYQQTTNYHPMDKHHQVAHSSSGKLIEDYYKNNTIFQQTDRYQQTGSEHALSINTESNVQHQAVPNYTQTTPVSKRSLSLNDCKPIQDSPAFDSRFNDSLTNLLGSPPPDSPLSRNPFFGDLQDILARDCKREIIPQSLFSREQETEKDNVFKRERRLQERFESLKAKNPLDIHQLSSFYRYQSALIETERFRSLHECQYPVSYKESLNLHYDNKIFSVMDRVEQSVLLLENANKENKAANQIAKPRPHLSKEAVYVMEEWYARNTEHPYPTSMTIEALAQAGNIGVEQVKKWFANKRNRSHNTRTLTEIAMKKRKLGQLTSQS